MLKGEAWGERRQARGDRAGGRGRSAQHFDAESWERGRHTLE